MGEQELKEESDDDNNAKVFDFVIESQKRKVELGKKGDSGQIVNSGFSSNSFNYYKRISQKYPPFFKKS